jgi:hypothetical protein
MCFSVLIFLLHLSLQAKIRMQCLEIRTVPSAVRPSSVHAGQVKIVSQASQR